MLFGQQEYEARHYGGPGTLYLYNTLQGIPPIEEVQQTGENVIWDLSAFTELNTYPKQIVNVSQILTATDFFLFCSLSSADCFSTWLSTEQALLSNDSIALLGFNFANLERYQNKTGNLLLETFFGFQVDFAGTPTHGVIVYNQPDTILHFPLSYSESWTSDIEWSIDLSITGQNVMYHSNQSRTSSVDAWGTVMTPYDTFTNVVRVRSEIVHEDTLVTDTLSVPVNITQVEYMWFDTIYKLPVLVATGIITDSLEIINSVEYLLDATCETPTWDASISEDVYYLDSTGHVTIDFEIINGNADEYSWDFGDGSIETSGGSISHTYSSGGLYSVGVTGCMTNCLPLNSCTFEILDFTIIDTVTSVTVIPGENLGIRIYPQPAEESFTIVIPQQLGSQNYGIFDLAGRKVGKGQLNAGESTIQTHQLEDGIFFILFQNPGEIESQSAILQLILLRQ